MIADALAWLTARIMPTSVLSSPQGAAFAVLQGEQKLVPVVGVQPMRRHVFQDLSDFAAFVNRRHEPMGSDILFDGTLETITASSAARSLIPDVVVCQLHHHPRWKRWNALLGKALDQRTFYRHLVTTPAEDSEVVMSTKGEPLGRAHLLAAQSVGTLRVAKGSTFTGELDPRGFYRVHDSAQSTEVNTMIPSSIAIDVPIYRLGEPDEWDERGQPADERGATYRVELELEVITDHSAPAFRLTAPGLDLVRHAAQVDALRLLRKRLDPGFLVGLGAYAVTERSL